MTTFGELVQQRIAGLIKFYTYVSKHFNKKEPKLQYYLSPKTDIYTQTQHT